MNIYLGRDSRYFSASVTPDYIYKGLSYKCSTKCGYNFHTNLLKVWIIWPLTERNGENTLGITFTARCVVHFNWQEKSALFYSCKRFWIYRIFLGFTKILALLLYYTMLWYTASWLMCDWIPLGKMLFRFFSIAGCSIKNGLFKGNTMPYKNK